MLPGGGLQALQGVLHLDAEALGELIAFEVVEAEAAGDGEAGRDRDAEGRHLGEARALAAEDVLHGGGAVGAALPEEVDQRLGVGAAHAGVAMSGEACRSCTRSSGIGVGYCPEKQAWQKPVVAAGGAQHAVEREVAQRVHAEELRISSIEWVEAISSSRVGVSMP